jgi:hypothetical protein
VHLLPHKAVLSISLYLQVVRYPPPPPKVNHPPFLSSLKTGVFQCISLACTLAADFSDFGGCSGPYGFRMCAGSRHGLPRNHVHVPHKVLELCRSSRACISSHLIGCLFFRPLQYIVRYCLSSSGIEHRAVLADCQVPAPTAQAGQVPATATQGELSIRTVALHDFRAVQKCGGTYAALLAAMRLVPRNSENGPNHGLLVVNWWTHEH